MPSPWSSLVRALPILTVTAGCWSVARPAAPSHLAAVAVPVTTAVLPSGLRVVIVAEPKAAEVAVTMRYGVGGDDDPAGREGLAHLAEHLSYEQRIEGRTLFDRLEGEALAFNGFTGRDTTTFTARGAAVQLGDLLAIEAARLARPCGDVDDAVYARQREVVRNELRERGDGLRAWSILERAAAPAGGPADGLAVAPSEAALDAMTRAQACGLATARYVAGDAVLVISGAVTPAAARAAVDAAFGAGATTSTTSTPAATSRPAAPTPGRPARVTARAPIGSAVVILSWPLPRDPAARAKARAVVTMNAARIQSEFAGVVDATELGGARAPRAALILSPTPGRSIDVALDDAARGLAHASEWFATGLFEQVRERAVYELIAGLEPGLARDRRLADAAIGAGATGDVAAVIAAEVDGLGGLSRGEAEGLARGALGFDAAAVIVLEPEGAHARGLRAHLAAPPDDLSGGRLIADPASATVAAPAAVSGGPLAGARLRQLATGLKVILLPSGTAPVVDVRLIFDAGTAAEPTGRRGVAMLASDGLSPDPADYPHLLTWFWKMGGLLESRVGPDHTSFAIHGLASRLDLWLDGLERIVRTGGYGSMKDALLRRRLAARATPAELAATYAWRRAIYGAQHPYVDGGLWQRVDEAALDVNEIQAFRVASFEPDLATLVITGGFDPDLADRWIDYTLGTWYGHGVVPALPPAALQPFAFAQRVDDGQVGLRIALPVAADGATGAPRSAARRAEALVVAEMVGEALADVRRGLAASYGLGGRLAEARLATTIEIEGEVDAARAAEAFALLRSRLAALRSPTADTAARFVVARRRVLARLRTPEATSTALADLAEQELALGDGIGAVAKTAEAVRTLTLPGAAPLLAGLDLAGAAILLRGPTDAVNAAYAALGRQGTFLPD